MLGLDATIDIVAKSASAKVFLTTLGLLIITKRPDIVDKENRVQSVPTIQLLAEYDYVIIGGGSAGAVLANRLSEDKDRTVLLLEAGDDEEVLSDVPNNFGIFFNTASDWNFKTESSSNYCLAMNNHQCNWPLGKVLGGSSVLNAMYYIRGNRRDYDSWAALGNAGWDYKSILPYFKKSEDARAEELVDSSYHQEGGYLTIERFRYESPIDDYIIHSGEELGYKVHDVNGENQTGFTYAYGTLRDGLRCSTAKAFLRSVSKRKNLHISLKSFVEKILVEEDGTSKIAYGVQFRKGRRRVIEAKREVILSAGAIQSPKLLMLSGIGPKDHLEEMNIPVVHHAPGVGQNLQDHVGMAGITYIVEPPHKMTRSERNRFTRNLSRIGNLESIQELIQNSSGPLYSHMISGGMAFIKTKYADKMIDYPDVQLFFSGASDYGSSIANSYEINLKTTTSMYKNITKNVQAFGILPCILRPRSRGFIKLKSSDPKEAPTIVPNYFEDPHDLQVLVESMRFLRKMVRTRLMQKVNARLNPNTIPKCSQFDISSDEYWACYARYFTSTINHPVSTCKMGPINDSHAVVDDRLRVHGVANLRVIDASIMPHIISGNTNAPTIMIAEKGADMIKQDWL
ncbi:Glucose dehydrogenase [acceptor] [Camponotus japonicus]